MDRRKFLEGIISTSIASSGITFPWQSPEEEYEYDKDMLLIIPCKRKPDVELPLVVDTVPAVLSCYVTSKNPDVFEYAPVIVHDGEVVRILPLDDQSIAAFYAQQTGHEVKANHSVSFFHTKILGVDSDQKVSPLPATLPYKEGLRVRGYQKILGSLQYHKDLLPGRLVFDQFVKGMFKEPDVLLCYSYILPVLPVSHPVVYDKQHQELQEKK